MARTTKKSSDSVIDEATTAEISAVVEINNENGNDKDSNENASDINENTNRTTNKNTKNNKNNMNTNSMTSRVKKIEIDTEIDDKEEIEVISLIPNVSYKDSHTGDFYEWEEVGHSEYLDFATIKNMWRTGKGYFRNLWLKPLDERVVAKYKLNKIYEEYDYLLDANAYTKQNIISVCEDIKNLPKGLIFTVIDKIKKNVAEGKINNISVIRTLDRQFDLNLIDMID